jgi:hypothetical protein
MHLEFKIGLDKTDSLNYPDFGPEEIDVFLNKAITKFVEQRAYGTNPKKDGLEVTQKRFDDLLTLISNTNISTFGTSSQLKPNAVTAALPSDYLHAIQEEVNISYLDCNNTITFARVPVYPITHDTYNKLIRDPFNKPDETGIFRMGLGGNMELISSSGVTITTYFLRYIAKPDEVRYGTAYPTPTTDVQCDLPAHTHREIIELAVIDALGNIEQYNRLPSEVQQANNME